MKHTRGIFAFGIAASLALVGCLSVATPASAAVAPWETEAVFDLDELSTMYRLYNQYTGEHLYTADAEERADLVGRGWTAEGVGWVAPKVETPEKDADGTSEADAEATTEYAPVYRLYNKFAPGGDHHYTMDKDEYDSLVEIGWTGEGIAWYSLDKGEGTPLYRLYNPYVKTCTHHYTLDTAERDRLVSLGWKSEDVAWYGYPGGLVTAYEQLGKPYEVGTTGPDAFDCSGFIWYCYGSARGRTTSQIVSSLKASGDWTENIDELKVGDLAFSSAGHVGIYVGNRRYIEASNSDTGVIEEYMYSFYGGGSYY